MCPFRTCLDHTSSAISVSTPEGEGHLGLDGHAGSHLGLLLGWPSVAGASTLVSFGGAEPPCPALGWASTASAPGS